LLAVAWLLSIALIGMVYSLAVNERRQEIGVLRALGFKRRFVAESLLTEGLILALVGGIAGIGLFFLSIYLFRNLIIQLVGVPFLIPSAASFTVLAAGALVLALVSVTLGALIPTMRISLMDPAEAMRK
jgi:putative ABC transport system permease protein